MDGVIQSCELDETLYHQTFVKAVVKEGMQRVCLFGGGEGALAREVLSYLTVQQIDMYEWDKEVVRIFQEHGASWSKGAWSNPRLRLFHENAFQIRADQHRLQYDAVLIDLFDLDESALETWIPFLQNAAAWCRKQIGLYVTTQAPFPNLEAPILERLSEVLRAAGFLVNPLSVYIPSFHGYATFLVGERFPRI
jgi:spermidine synthase